MIKILIKKRVVHNKKHPFRILTNRAFYDKRLTPMAKILLQHLLGCTEKKYTPTIPQIAKQFNVSESTVDRAVSNLVKYGYMTSVCVGSVKTGKKVNKTMSWHIYELPDYLDESTDAIYDNINNGSTDAIYDNINNESSDAIYDNINNESSDAIYDNINNESSDANSCDAIYKDIDCGGITTPPQSTNEENKTILPPKPFNEMNEEELSKYFPF